MAGRLNGVEIARSEGLAAGKVPLITLRSDVDYAITEAHTLFGRIGVKVWVYHGEVFSRKDKFAQTAEEVEKGKKRDTRK
jgi:small subunit ribosomal protein S3